MEREANTARQLTKEEREYLEELYSSMANFLKNLAKLHLYDANSAEDAVQETFIVAQVRIQILMEKPDPKAWLINVLKHNVLHENRAMQRFRQLYQKIELYMESPYAEDRYFEQDLLKLLDKEEYEVLKLVYIDGHSDMEASEILGIKYDAYRKRKQTAKRKLLEELD